MKRDELKELIGEEKLDEVMALYGKSVNTLKVELDGLKTQLAELENTKGASDKTLGEKDKTIKELETKISTLDTTQKELEELKTKIAERELNELKAKEESNVLSEFNTLVGDRKFINEYTKNAVIEQFKEALKANPNKEEVFTTLTKDKTDLFESPNKVEIPATGDVDANITKEAHARELMGL